MTPATSTPVTPVTTANPALDEDRRHSSLRPLKPSLRPVPPSARARELAPLFPGHPIFGAGQLFRTRPIETLFEITGACGDIARLRFPLKPHMAHLLRHPDYVRHVLVDNSKNYGKQTRGYSKLRSMLGSGLVTSEGEFWKRQRRIANPAFHRERIAHFSELMVTCADEMLGRWSEYIVSGKPFDVSREMMRLTLRVIGLTMLSTDVEAQSSAVGDAIDDLLHITIHRINTVLGWPEWVPTAENRRYDRARNTLDKIVNDMIAERRRSGEDKGDLLSMLMAARDPETGEGMSDTQLRDEAMTVFVAGHETTANALAWTLCLLSRHPDAERALRQEVAQVLGDRPPKLEDLERLVQTDRVLKESMRLVPPVWVIARSAMEDDVIGGYRIPKDTWIFVSPYLTHHDPRFWRNPEGFDPARFTPEEEAKRPKGAYFPFALGPRKCIGEVFAMMEARLILASILQRTRLELLPGRSIELDPTVTLRPKRGLWMTAKPLHS
jgi:cytochrome P450